MHSMPKAPPGGFQGDICKKNKKDEIHNLEQEDDNNQWLTCEIEVIVNKDFYNFCQYDDRGDG